MKTRTLAILTLLAAALLVVAVMAYTKRSAEFASDAPAALYPTLSGRFGDIATIHVYSPDGEFHIDLSDGVWRMREKDGYPIRPIRVRNAVLSLSDLKVIEPKTSKPENYALIGVQDPGDDAKSVLVEMADADGNNIVSIVLGRIEPGLNTSHRYVRLTDDPRSYYIQGVADVEPDPMRWIDREVLRAPRAYTRQIVITHPDGEVVSISRPDMSTKDFSLDNIPQGVPAPDPLDINLLASSFLYIGLEDVASLASAGDPAPGPVAVSRTFDGFVMTAHLFDVGDKTWAWFEASSEQPTIDADASGDDSAESEKSPAVKLRPYDEILAKVEEYNNKLRGWRFQLTEGKTDLLSKRMSDLLPDNNIDTSSDTSAAAASPAPSTPTPTPDPN